MRNLSASASLPVHHEFILMQRSPLKDHRAYTVGRTASDYTDRIDSNDELVIAIDSVKVRRSVICIEHAYRDPVESGNLGHISSARSCLQRR